MPDLFTKLSSRGTFRWHPDPRRHLQIPRVRRCGVGSERRSVMAGGRDTKSVQVAHASGLLRDQGARIVENTRGAATTINEGLDEMDATVGRLRKLIARLSSDDVLELRSLVEAAGATVFGVLGHPQFQDVTRRQLALLSRLSRSGRRTMRPRSASALPCVRSGRAGSAISPPNSAIDILCPAARPVLVSPQPDPHLYRFIGRPRSPA
jgi:hypothetical protein